MRLLCSRFSMAFCSCSRSEAKYFSRSVIVVAFFALAEAVLGSVAGSVGAAGGWVPRSDSSTIRVALPSVMMALEPLRLTIETWVPA